MKTTIRRAEIADAHHFVRIKNQLPMVQDAGQSASGGFLLGTDLLTYQTYIASAHCLVAEVNEVVVGFGILLPDGELRKAEIWQKRDLADWKIDLLRYEGQQLAYFEQLAFLPGHRRLVLKLAFNLIHWAIASGAETIFATTVRAPVLNLAAVPFIRAAGGHLAGNIDETYPGIGHINSDIYLVEASAFSRACQGHSLFPYLEQHLIPLP